MCVNLIIDLINLLSPDGKKKLETCTGDTVEKLSDVLTANLSNLKCVTVMKHKTIAIHMKPSQFTCFENRKWMASEKMSLFLN